MLLLLLVAALAGCGGDDSSDGGNAQQSDCDVQGDAQLAELEEGKTYRLVMQTNKGAFTIELDRETAPCTSASFVSLANKDFFNGTKFHRIVPGFVIQGGDPTGTGTGGPGYSTVDVPPDDAKYTKGVVAMAKTRPSPQARLAANSSSSRPTTRAWGRTTRCSARSSKDSTSSRRSASWAGRTSVRPSPS